MSPTPAHHPKAEATRAAILQAAVLEFAQEGEAGARTEAIARAAGVNKALLHYHFGTKELLYDAVLEEVFSGLKERFLAVAQGPGTPGERLLRYFLFHFDHLAEAGSYTRLLGQEMMRARSGQPSHIPQITKVAFGPVHLVLRETVEAGIAAGELRQQAPGPVLLALLGANVFYFMSSPFFREIAGRDPRDPELLALQRVALVDTAATLLFAQPEQGRALGVRILSETPATQGGLS